MSKYESKNKTCEKNYISESANEWSSAAIYWF